MVFQLPNSHTRKFIGALIFGVAGVAFDPVPANFVFAEGPVQPLPELDILDRFLVSRAPVVALPGVYLGRDAVPQVGAIGVDVHDGRPLQRLKRHDGCH